MVEAHKKGLVWYIPPGGSYKDGRGIQANSANNQKSRDLKKWRKEQKAKEDAEKLPGVEAELDTFKKKYKNAKARELYAKGKATCEAQGGKWDGTNRACILPGASDSDDNKVIQFPNLGKNDEKPTPDQLEQFFGLMATLKSKQAMGEGKSLNIINQLIKGIK